MSDQQVASRPMRSEQTDVPSLGSRVHARTWLAADPPAGPPIVLVHGLGMSSRYFIPMAQQLVTLGHDVLAPDLPGFGRSKPARSQGWPGGPDPGEQTDHLTAWLDARGIPSAVFVGNSAGVQCTQSRRSSPPVAARCRSSPRCLPSPGRGRSC